MIHPRIGTPKQTWKCRSVETAGEFGYDSAVVGVFDLLRDFGMVKELVIVDASDSQRTVVAGAFDGEDHG
jgi:hypothetical protein